MRVTSRRDRDAGRTVQKHVAVDVFDDRALSARHDERIVAGIRRRDKLPIALDDRARLRTGQGRFDVRHAHGDSVIRPWGSFYDFRKTTPEVFFTFVSSASLPASPQG